MAVEKAPQVAMKNRKAVEESESCGCYYCGCEFSSQDITKWTDDNQTALCPKCEVDSVIPISSGIDISTENLKVLHDYWFSPRKTSDSSAV